MDPTESKRRAEEQVVALERALQRSEAKFRRMFDAAAVSLWLEDFSQLCRRLDQLKTDGVSDVRQYCRDNPGFVREATTLVRVLDVNQQTLRLFDAESREQLKEEWEHTFVAESDGAIVDAIVALAEGRRTFETERVGRTLHGKRVHVAVSVQLLSLDEGDALAIVTMLDLTEQKLRKLLCDRALTAQDEERRRVARELHDEAGQSLTSIVLGLQELQQVEKPEAARALGARLQRVAETTMDEIGRLARGLHPYVLEDLGLTEALQRHIGEVSRCNDLHIDLQIVGMPRSGEPPRTVSTALYRIVQEALTNVIRHAGAGQVSIILRWSARGVRLVVEDDGQGFDTSALDKSDGLDSYGLGLQGIRERVVLLGGSWTIDSTPEGGTTLAVKIPL